MLKQISFLLAVLLINFSSVCAQNWQTVRSGRIAYFNSDQGKIKCIRIDSVKFDKDSVLFPMHNIQQLDYNCFTPKGNSWIGKRVIIKNNGVNLFFNNYDDTIRINTRAKVGDSWNFFEIKDSIKVIAEVKSTEIQAVLNQPDSVKTIGFKVYDKNGLATNHPLNEKTIILSKNSGFVKAMSFNEFPEDWKSTYFENIDLLTLIGLTNPALGVQNLTWLGVHYYQVGDELHTLTKRWDWSAKPEYYNTYKTIWKILERKESKDSVFYRIERKESLEKIVEKWENVTYTFTHDTITKVYKPDTLFDKLPGEPIVSDYGAEANMMIKEEAFIKKFRSDLPINKSSDDSCWHFLNYDGSGPGYYLKGLGGPYYEWSEINRGEDNSLVYYKKGATTWGTPLVITDAKGFEIEDEIKIYPNPTADFAKIEISSGKTEKYILSLTDMQGREVVKNEIVIANTYKLDISSLKDGAYLLKLQNGDTQFSKVIVKKQ